MTVLSVTASLQAEIGLPFSRYKRATIEMMAPVLMMTATISRVHELGESRNEVNRSTELRFTTVVAAEGGRYAVGVEDIVEEVSEDC